MKEDRDYIRDIAEMRSLMERSSKFLSLSGFAGILVGVYALAGSCVVYKVFDFHPEITGSPMTSATGSLHFPGVIFTALIILLLSLITGALLAYKKASARREKFWNATAKRVVINMAVPLVTGGLLILILISKGLVGLMAPLTLLFYGLALYNASKFTYEEVRSLGIIEITLGLAASWFIDYAILIWAIGFGIMHIVYGIYLHFKYEK